MAHDHFQTPPDPQKGYKNQKMTPTTGSCWDIFPPEIAVVFIHIPTDVDHVLNCQGTLCKTKTTQELGPRCVDMSSTAQMHVYFSQGWCPRIYTHYVFHVNAV